jgi:hypothetical protein
MLASIAIGGCEVVVDSTELPYTPHIVVNAILSTDDSLTEIELSKTLPLSQPYTRDAAWITDATASITFDGVQYPLRYLGEGKYMAEGLPIQTGKRYTLDVSWHGLHTSGSTEIPVAAPIDTGRVSIVTDEFGYSQAIVWWYTHVPKPVALLATYEYKHHLTAWDSIYMERDPNYRPDTFWHSMGVEYYDVALAKAVDRDSAGFHAYGSIDPDEDYRAVLYTYDAGFYEFARTYRRYYDDSPFGSGGTNPRWNLDGDGIGLFIGVAATRRPIDLH